MKKFKVVLTRSKKDGMKWLKAMKKEKIDVFCVPVQIYRFFKIKDFVMHKSSVLLFTSTKGIEGFLKVSKEINFDCIVLGDREEKMARELGFNILLKPKFPDSENLLEKIIKEFPKEREIIYPASKLYNRQLENNLKEKGFKIKVLILYRPVKRKISRRDLEKIKKCTDIVFFSPSQIENFFSQVPVSNLKSKNFWAIGPKTFIFLKKIVNCKALKNPSPEELIKKIKRRKKNGF